MNKVKIKVYNEGGTQKISMGTDIYLCDINPKRQPLPVDGVMELIKQDIEYHTRHKPVKPEKVKDWRKLLTKLLEEYGRLSVLYSLGVSTLPLVITDGKVEGLREGIEVELERCDVVGHYSNDVNAGST